MRFRNAIHITMDNYSSAFKMLLYRLVVGVLIFSLVYVILQLSLSVIVTSTELQTLKDLVGEFFRALFGGDSVRLESFQTDFTGALTDFLSLIARNGGAIAGAVVGVCLMYVHCGKHHERQNGLFCPYQLLVCILQEPGKRRAL